MSENTSVPLMVRAVTVKGRAVTVTVEPTDLAENTVLITASTSSGDRFASARQVKGKWALSTWQDENENPFDDQGLTSAVARMLSASGLRP